VRLRALREGIEDLCDIFERLCREKIAKVYCSCKERFLPGAQRQNNLLGADFLLCASRKRDGAEAGSRTFSAENDV
jgi:hypothetical protein